MHGLRVVRLGCAAIRKGPLVVYVDPRPGRPVVLATHRRSFDRGQQIEDPAHIEELERHKRLAREHRATDRLHHAAPSSKALFVAAAERNHHLGVLARALIELLNAHGPVALEGAIAAALQSDAAYLGGVRHFIDRYGRVQRRPVVMESNSLKIRKFSWARRLSVARQLNFVIKPKADSFKR